MEEGRKDRKGERERERDERRLCADHAISESCTTNASLQYGSNRAPSTNADLILGTNLPVSCPRHFSLAATTDRKSSEGSLLLRHEMEREREREREKGKIGIRTKDDSVASTAAP